MNIDESTGSLGNSYAGYAEYAAAAAYYRSGMVLDPESLQFYRTGLLGADGNSTANFRVNEHLIMSTSKLSF